MPKFGFNPNDVTLGIILFPKNEYEMEIGEPKTFFAQGKDGKEDRAGVAVNLKITEGEYKGKNYYCASDLAQSYGEQQAYALLVTSQGFEANDEGVKQFREKFGQMDFTVDTDAKALGEGWNLMKGRMVWVDLDQIPDKRPENAGKFQQSFPKFRPHV